MHLPLLLLFLDPNEQLLNSKPISDRAAA
eukprot:COSAG06_NODE_63983_length_260_cov_9.888199_1_plen_28_part_10